MNEQKVFQNRRCRLGLQNPRTLFLIPSGTVQRRSHAVKFPFHTASDFYYLTGLEAADHAVLVLGDESWLIGREERDPLWGEDIVPAENELIGLECFPRAELEAFLERHRHELDQVALPLGLEPELERVVLEFMAYRRERARNYECFPALIDSSLAVGRLRAIKEPEEIESLREASRRSSQVHQRAREMDFIGWTEREVAAWFEAQFLLLGMRWTAYQTIVGSGDRSTILHARPSQRVIQREDLILIDAGGEWRGYCADITRVLPAGGRFTDRQEQIYWLVLRAQEAALRAVAPGSTLSAVDATARAVLRDGLEGLGLSEAAEKLNEVFPHFTSHWLGLDVHDPCPQREEGGQEVRLEAGMCLTVEPGLYFRSDELSGDYHGLGVRIEDNVIVTENGYENLTEAPKRFQ